MTEHIDRLLSIREGTFKGFSGINLYYQNWYQSGKARGILIIVHGLGGHSGCYANIAEYLIPQQYSIYGLDLRGHGRSPGPRGYINAWAELREDLRAFINFIHNQQSGCPIFLLGHSLGAVIVFDYLLRYPQDGSLIQGVIALAPSIGDVRISSFRLFIGKLLSRLWPRFTLSTGLDLTTATRDEKILITYTQDKLRHTLGTARLATEFLATRIWINAHAAEWCVPLLILQGGADLVALPIGSKIFYQLITYPDKLLIEYPDAYHELHCDLDYQQVLSDLSNWLEQHLSN